MSMVTQLTAAFQQVANTFKYLLYLPVRPVDGDYELRLTGSVASWLNKSRSLFTAAGPITTSGTTNVTLVSGTTPTLQPGTYRVLGRAQLSVSNANTIPNVALLNGATVLLSSIQPLSLAGQTGQVTIELFITFATAQTFNPLLRLNRAAGTGNVTATVMNISVERWS